MVESLSSDEVCLHTTQETLFPCLPLYDPSDHCWYQCGGNTQGASRALCLVSKANLKNSNLCLHAGTIWTGSRWVCWN